ncbi:MAG: hypothetical protein SFW35_04990 [Chitinophagales bacterium]|nr:hypothetical protein [Chitinophagales bacterium]
MNATTLIVMLGLVFGLGIYFLMDYLGKRKRCPACKGTGRIQALRGIEPCRVCKGTGKRRD